MGIINYTQSKGLRKGFVPHKTLKGIIAIILSVWMMLSSAVIPVTVFASQQTIDITNLSSWNNVTNYLSGPSVDVNGGYDLVKFWITNDTNYLYVRWDIQLWGNQTDLQSTYLNVVLSTSANGSTADAAAILSFDSHSAVTASLQNLGTSVSVDLDAANNVRWFNEGAQNNLVSIVAKISFSAFNTIGLNANFNSTSSFPLWAQDNASQSPSSNIKDRIPAAGYFSYNAATGSAAIVGSTASSAKDILTYTIPNGVTSINSTAGTISVTLPAGTNLSNLVATFTTSANIKDVTVNGVNQVSGTTGNDFTNPVTYVVTAEDGTTKNWVVTVSLQAAAFDVSYIISTIAGGGTSGYLDNVNALSAELSNPYKIAFDGSGNMYFADENYNIIRKVDASTGKVSTYAGNHTRGYSGDTGLATDAQLSFPRGVAFDSSGNMYIADYDNSVIRKVNASDGKISTIAGNYTLGAGYTNLGAGYFGDGGLATSAKLNSPEAVAVDSQGNVYIADTANNVIRKVDVSNGKISTVAGNYSKGYGYSGDTGVATEAQLYTPVGVAFDNQGNMYIADGSNYVIRKVDTHGYISTYAGNHTWASSGDGGPATSAGIGFPYDVAVDSEDNLYIVDDYNLKVHVVDAASGNIFTIAGTGEKSWSGIDGNNGPATLAKLGGLLGVALDRDGNIYFSDYSANVIRKLAPQQHFITYSSNGANSGSAPSDNTAYASGATVTVRDNTGGMAKSGYTFTGWNTRADGTGTNYAANATFSMGAANVTLYAMWGVPANSGNNTFSASPSSITAGGSVTLTAVGDRQSVSGSVYGDERYIPTTWVSTETGKSGSFTLSGGSYTAAYTPSTAGSYTITATFKKQTWDGTQWVDSGSTDTKTTTLTVNAAATTANSGNNTFSASPASVTLGGSVTLTAAGDRQSVSGSVNGDERYIPKTWISTETGKSGTFTLSGGSYTATYATSTAGSYTVTATFKKQTWNGTQWVDSGATDTKTTTLTVNAPGTFTVTGIPGDSHVNLDWPSVTGAVYYAVYKDGAYLASVTSTVSGSVYGYDATGLTNGTTYNFEIRAYDSSHTIIASGQISMAPQAPSSGGSSGGGSSVSANTGVDVLVNGKAENAGTATAGSRGSQTVTTIAVDEQKLEKKLEAEGDHAVVTIPVNTKSDIVVGELNGQMVKNMETRQATLEVRTETASYFLPAQQINIDAISAQVGKSVELKDIKVQVEIAKSTTDTVKVVENSAQKGSFTIVAPPMDFTVKGTYGGKTVDVSKFNIYVERLIAIPDGVDPNKITTGIITEPDGASRHVPTEVTTINGKYYAKINSLTNSTYSVVWHPLEFKDVADHWAKTEVNDMGSRMVVYGVGNDLYEPDRDITRAEFATIVVRALGLKPGDGSNPFNDVDSGEWYCDYIKTATSYKIIEGYGNGKFGPMDKITREQAMTMIARAMNITGLKADLASGDVEKLLAGFTDGNNAADYAKTNIAACVKTGIVAGRGNNLVAPKDNITRAEVAAIVRRLLQKSKLI